ncbi:MAG TPA: YceI family protein [Candidatus Cybelea sp.]|jgi:polyisoprenoid-binding protein YceI|nr:YceI family protein [Candidatus Cybelea sp.]
MRRNIVFVILALVQAPMAASGQQQAIVWQADLVHCRAEFTVSHMVVSKVWGHIPVRALTIVNAGHTPVPQHLDAVLDVSHEDTDNHDRDADLRSPTYFDTTKYPMMTFRSTSIVARDDNDFTVTGELTIKGVTKPVTFPVQVVGIIPEGKGWRVGYTGSLTIDRREWGIVDARLTAAGVLLVGYTVNIGLTVEAVTNSPWLHVKT